MARFATHPHRLTDLPASYSGVTDNFGSQLPTLIIPKKRGRRLARIRVTCTLRAGATPGTPTKTIDHLLNMVERFTVTGQEPGQTGTRNLVDVGGAELAKLNALMRGKVTDANQSFGLTAPTANQVVTINYDIPFEQDKVVEAIQHVHSLPLDAFTGDLKLDIKLGEDASSTNIAITTATGYALAAGFAGIQVDVTPVYRDAPYIAGDADFGYQRVSLKTEVFKPLASATEFRIVPTADAQGQHFVSMVSCFASDARSTAAKTTTNSTDYIKLRSDDTDLSVLTEAQWREFTSDLIPYYGSVLTAAASSTVWNNFSGPLLITTGTNFDSADWFFPSALPKMDGLNILVANVASTTQPIVVTTAQAL
jgi:hypothetical protein